MRLLQFLLLLLAIVINSSEELDENNLRIAYFPNIGHAVPIIGIENGFLFRTT